MTNNSVKIRAVCKGKGCGWTLYARVQTKDYTTFRANTLMDVHSCGIVSDNKKVTATWLAKHFIEDFRMNPNMTYNNFNTLTAKTKFSDTSSYAFYNTTNKAKEIMEGYMKEQYRVLDDYCKQLLHHNPGSTTIIKRYCKGMLLVAVGIDENNGMFPIAYAICEKENTDTWNWFLKLLKEDLEVIDTRRYTLISDRQKGLENALGSLFDGAEIRFCVRHLHANFKKKFPGLLLKQKLWACAQATTPEYFKRRMAEMKEVNEKAYVG
ncbi:uncharacterized protein LOC133785853 [Humulus lupulus]|uniref:uncharacterized protein LOC133785853 n=1 Tax=Humulus lupulus TaxID=3486 RepID=UPI002B407159|nr:uncharacterized protein LOC133785853 [Humulus lupulus]